MRYHARNLQGIYEILETLPKPIAVLDFFCGEVGHELGVTQSLGGQFYDKYHDVARVVALCWQGASLLYTNLSDDQIEFTDKKQSRSGDRRHDGGRKIHWLRKQGHGVRIAAIAGIVARLGAQDVSEKTMVRQHGLSAVEQWARAGKRLARTGFVFSTEGERLVQNSYIALFDRNERHQPERNTQRWQVDLFHKWAHEFGFQLVIISDFYPRPQPDDVICFAFNRNFDLLCNIIRHSVLYVAPPSGAGDAGMVFGCNLVETGSQPKKYRDVLLKVIMGRDFQHLGVLNSPNGETANKVREYLIHLMGEMK
jgi:hypothetical protein